MAQSSGWHIECDIPPRAFPRQRHRRKLPFILVTHESRKENPPSIRVRLCPPKYELLCPPKYELWSCTLDRVSLIVCCDPCDATRNSLTVFAPMPMAAQGRPTTQSHNYIGHNYIHPMPMAAHGRPTTQIRSSPFVLRFRRCKRYL